MRVLLVGGAGFMGARAARRFAEQGHAVTVLTRSPHALPEGVEALIADRSDPVALGRVLEHRRFDFTVDFVAFDAGDVEALLRVPYAALGRYVLISTGQVFLVTQGRPGAYREEDDAAPLMPEPEPGPEHDQWSYGVGKRRAEGVLFSLRASHGVRGTSLRLPIVHGAGDPSLRLWAWLERMRDGGPILLPEGDRPVRFLAADDVAEALVRLAEGPLPREAAYNLAQPEILSLRAFLDRVAHAAGLTPRFVEVSWPELEAAGLDRLIAPFTGPWASVLDPSRAVSEWGFQASRVDEYLPAAVRAHLEHPPAESHRGHTRRDAEIALATRLMGARMAS